MAVYMLIFVAALLTAIVGTPVVRRVALRTGAMDQPSARKIHANPMPRLGGVAIYSAFILALVLLGDYNYVSQVVGILAGATMVSFLGIWDDRRSLRPMIKLGGQVLAAGVLIATGVQVQFVRFLPVDIPFVNEIVTVVWVVGITNAMNFLDNMDGLSSGVAAVAAGFFLLLAAFSGQYLVASLAAALLGACVGFLYYNFNPATIFMGDSGSLFIGFVLAAVGIKLRFDNPAIVTWMVPVLVLGLPIFDTTLVMVSRVRRGVNPFTTAGKDHTSHRLVDLGFTRREAVLILYMVCVVFGMIALFLTRASMLEAYATAGVVAGLALVALIRLEFVRPARETRSPALRHMADLTAGALESQPDSTGADRDG